MADRNATLIDRSHVIEAGMTTFKGLTVIATPAFSRGKQSIPTVIARCAAPRQSTPSRKNAAG